MTPSLPPMQAAKAWRSELVTETSETGVDPGAHPRRTVTARRVALGIALLLIAALVVLWLVLRLVLGAVFAFIRMGLFIVLFGIVAWVVLIGPPEFGKKR